uniref:Cadherin domain-containing protein n=1 Tax=Pelusios castaneus TaxID=367368 RepID=A0A8C8VET2_9SAUR
LIKGNEWPLCQADIHLAGNEEGLFGIDPESGMLYLNRPLDREKQAFYTLQVTVKDEDKQLFFDPVTITISVKDENDNMPVLTEEMFSGILSKGTKRGTSFMYVSAIDMDDPSTPNADLWYKILSQTPSQPSENMFQVDSRTGAISLSAEGKIPLVKAEDADDPKTNNAKIAYEILRQEPQVAEGFSFHIGRDTGVVTLQDSLQKTNAAKHYRLLVLAADRAGTDGGFSSTCTVLINVVDVNDSPPVFSQTKFGPFSVPEDTEVGTLITTITATDEDEEMKFKLINFSVESGNEDGTFKILSNPQNGTASIWLEKELDYETVQRYVLVVSVSNNEELIGKEQDASSTATVHVLVKDVNEAPVVAQERYEVNILESVELGTVLLAVKATDPDIFHTTSLSYSLRNDSMSWLSIDEQSGEVRVIQALDREMVQDVYTVQVIAQDKGSPSMTGTADIAIHILDVNDNAPFLVGDYSKSYLCTPQREKQSIIISAFDPDGTENSVPFIFALANSPMLRRNWRINLINDTHAYLTMGISWLEPGVHLVTIILKDMTICLCTSEGECILEVRRMEGKPTVISAVSIVVGTLGTIGLFVLIIFVHLTLLGANKKKKRKACEPL